MDDLKAYEIVNIEIEDVGYNVAEAIEAEAVKRVGFYETPFTVVLGWHTFLSLCHQATPEGAKLNVPQILMTTCGTLEVLVDGSVRDSIKVLSHVSDNMIIARRALSACQDADVKRKVEAVSQ